MHSIRDMEKMAKRLRRSKQRKRTARQLRMRRRGMKKSANWKKANKLS